MMLSRTGSVILPTCTQVRGMATLKDISSRLKSVTNIQKITKSMKIVSAAKFAKAERELKPTRAFGEGTQDFYKKTEVQADPEKPKHLIIAMSSDKGLCGAIHAGIGRAIRASIPEKPPGTEVKIVCVGDKQRAALQRFHSDKILMHFMDVGRKPPTFSDAGLIANEIVGSGFEYDHCELYYNFFKTVVSYDTTIMPIFTKEQVTKAEKFSSYDSIDEDVLRCYSEFSFAAQIFYTMKEGLVSELSARMTAMDGASKNAGEMIDKLRLLYNRKRQAVITTELIEIISGASALE